MSDGQGALGVSQALDRARGAAGALPEIGERIELLGRLLETFGDATSEPRRQLEAELVGAAGFSTEVVREGLRVGLEDFGEAALRALALRELGPDLGASGTRRLAPFDVVAVVLGGAIPMPSLLGIVAPLLLGSPVVVKPSSRDPVTARIAAEALTRLSPELGAALALAPFRGEDVGATAALCQAPCLVASGSDATIRALRAQLRPGARFVAYGHKVSVAVLDANAEGDALARDVANLANDVCLWDQLGCLSPAFALVVGAPRVPDRLMDALAGALEMKGRALPRGHVDIGSRAAIAHERDEAMMRAEADDGVNVRDGSDFVLIAEADSELRPATGHRLLRLLPQRDAAELEDTLTRLGDHLAGVAVAGGARRALQPALLRSGASRICPLGQLQAPPLGWSHDGQPVLLPLARFIDLEPD